MTRLVEKTSGCRRDWRQTGLRIARIRLRGVRLVQRAIVGQDRVRLSVTFRFGGAGSVAAVRRAVLRQGGVGCFAVLNGHEQQIAQRGRPTLHGIAHAADVYRARIVQQVHAHKDDDENEQDPEYGLEETEQIVAEGTAILVVVIVIVLFVVVVVIVFVVVVVIVAVGMTAMMAAAGTGGLVVIVLVILVLVVIVLVILVVVVFFVVVIVAAGAAGTTGRALLLRLLVVIVLVFFVCVVVTVVFFVLVVVVLFLLGEAAGLFGAALRAAGDGRLDRFFLRFLFLILVAEEGNGRLDVPGTPWKRARGKWA